MPPSATPVGSAVRDASAASTVAAGRAVRGQTLLAVFAGGALGTVARAALTRGLPHDPGAWPWATFAVNLLGALLLGWWATRLLRSPGADPRARPFLATGVCGGLTTFSTLQVELVTLLREGDGGLAAAYATASVVLGLLAVLAGRAAARRGTPGSPRVVDEGPGPTGSAGPTEPVGRGGGGRG